MVALDYFFYHLVILTGDIQLARMVSALCDDVFNLLLTWSTQNLSIEFVDYALHWLVITLSDIWDRIDSYRMCPVELYEGHLLS